MIGTTSMVLHHKFLNQVVNIFCDEMLNLIDCQTSRTSKRIYNVFKDESCSRICVAILGSFHLYPYYEVLCCNDDILGPKLPRKWVNRLDEVNHPFIKGI